MANTGRPTARARARRYRPGMILGADHEKKMKKDAYVSADPAESIVNVEHLSAFLSETFREGKSPLVINNPCTFKAHKSSPNLSPFRKRKWSDHTAQALYSSIERYHTVGDMRQDFFVFLGCLLQHLGPTVTVEV